MTLELSDITLTPYRQTLGAVAGILTKGREANIDLDEVLGFSLYEDMLPFSFQIHSVVHHSLGALKGLESGAFGPPQNLPELDYAGLQKLVDDTRATVDAYDANKVNARTGGEVVFGFNDMRIPFTSEGFVVTFSLPNLHFHATTAYDILRLKGVPLGKLNYMGQMQVKG